MNSKVWPAWFSTRAVDLVMGIFLCAGILKAIDVPHFADTLATWRYIPQSLVPLLAYLVPMLEIALALSWFLRLYPRVAVIGVQSLLVLFSTVYLFHTRDPGPPPDCGCLGRIVRYELQQSAILSLAGRNAGLFLMLLAGAWFSGTFSRASSRLSAPQNRVSLERSCPETRETGPTPREALRPREGDQALIAKANRAFSLLELLVVIAVVALVLSLAAPALSGVWDRAKSARTLANLRSHAINMIAYTGDWDGQFLAMTDPRDEITTIEMDGRSYTLTYWAPTVAWPLGLLDEYYGGNMGHASLLGDDDDVAQVWGNWGYKLSASFLARPEFWNPSTREGINQLGSTRLSDVTFPSRKGMFVPYDDMPSSDYKSSLPNLVWHIGFVDGSASPVKQGDLRPGYKTAESGIGSGGFWYGRPVMHTLDGVHGYDLK